MALDPRYFDSNYDPNGDWYPDEPAQRDNGGSIPNEPGPFPGDPDGTGVITEYPGPVGPPNAAPLPPQTPPPSPPPSGPGPTPEPGPQPGPQPLPSGGSGGGGAVSSLPPASPAPNAYAGPSWNDIVALFNKQPEKTPVQSAYQDALLKFMGKAQQTPTLEDANLSPQVEQYRVQAQRNQERNRAAAVQRASTGGQNNSGYLNNAILRGIEEQGFNTAGFNANLLAKEYDKQRQDLQAALQLASATGDREAQRELQARLAQVSAAMQQQGLSLQSELGHGDLDLRRAIADMQNNQFYDSLGVNTALGLEGLNQRALELVMRNIG